MQMGGAEIYTTQLNYCVPIIHFYSFTYLITFLDIYFDFNYISI